MTTDEGSSELASDAQAPAPAQVPDYTSLGDLLVSLQKSFSWVSSATASIYKSHPAEPRSLITGEVDFELTIRGDVAPVTGWILIRESGPITLKLAGTIQHDIVVVDPPDTDGPADSYASPAPDVPEDSTETNPDVLAEDEADLRAGEEADLAQRAAEDAARRVEEAGDG